MVRRVQDAGFGVLFVSHDLDEVLTVTDHVTVLRDGRVVGTGPTAGFTRDDLVRLIVGHDIPPAEPRAPEPRRTDRLIDVHGLSGPGARNVNFSIAPGEILGTSGLIGSGFAEIGPMLIGSLPARRGKYTSAPPRSAWPTCCRPRPSPPGSATCPASGCAKVVSAN